MTRELPSPDRVISLGEGLPKIPERLLLAHARGEVLFICGAGISMPTLPDFRKLVIQVYSILDTAVHKVIDALPSGVCNHWQTDVSMLNESQKAEVKRFIIGDYDVVLGMLERRLDGQTLGGSKVRKAVKDCLKASGVGPSQIHRSLMKLSDRGGVTTVVTTNFDLLLESAKTSRSGVVQTYSLGGIPRPTRQADFAGVLHIHGAIDTNPSRISELVLTEQDFGEFYLRRRVVPDFIYDAARLFNLVLVGYSANDPPMRYLLNAVAADGTRFEDLKERFTFIGMNRHDPVALEDWKARGITPISYNSNGAHVALHNTLKRWSELSAINGNQRSLDAEIKRIVKNPRSSAPVDKRDLFDHLIRRSNSAERTRLSQLASTAGADIGWLSAIIQIGAEKER